MEMPITTVATPANMIERSDLSLSASERSSVSFSTIEIHEHPIILGNGQSTSGSGPCLEIDWTEQANLILNLEEYESMRDNLPRRHKNQLLMPGKLRQDLLLGSGYTMRELNEVATSHHKSRSKSLMTKKVLKRLSSAFSKSS